MRFLAVCPANILQAWSELRLRTQIIMLVGLAILLILFIGVFSFGYTRRITEQRAQLFMETLSRQVEDQTQIISADMKNLARVVGYSAPVQEFLSATIPLDRLEKYQPVKTALLSYQSAIRDIYAIALLDTEGRLTDATQSIEYGSLPDVVNLIESRYGMRKAAFTNPLFTSVFQTKVSSVRTGDVFAYLLPVNSIETYASSERRIGTVLILCSTSRIRSMVENINAGSNSFFLVMDEEESIIAHNNEVMMSQLPQKAARPEEPSRKNRILAAYHSQSGFLVQEQHISSLGWSIVSVVNVGDTDRDLTPVKNIAIIIAFSAVMLLVLIGFMLMRGISGPVSRIVDFLNAYPSASYKERMKPGSSNEMGQIVGHFNRLMDKMEEVNRAILATQARLYEAELEGKKAQLSALQSQIHPHFLYNTLDCVRSIALVHDLQPIVDISVSMSAIFRYSIKADGDATVREEMEIVRHYIRIIQIRHRERIVVSVDMPDDLLECVIPRMILQPVVENAVYHGLEPKEGNGRMMIRGNVMKEQLLLTIEDDGVGMAPETEARIQLRLRGEGAPEEDEGVRKTSGIGLLNIQRRLRFRYGALSGLTFNTIPTGGTRVLISLPIIRKP
mgnify:CR=1 FL=1